MYTVNWSQELAKSLHRLYPKNVTEKMVCVEIGSFEGRGSNLIYDKLCQHPESILYCIDPWNDTYEKCPDFNKYLNGQYLRFLSNIKGKDKIIPLRGTSDDMINFVEQKVDFAFIDGDHTPEQVYKDAVMLFPKMKNGGIILFDDYLWEYNGIKPRGGIDKFLQEYSDKYQLLFKSVELCIKKI